MPIEKKFDFDLKTITRMYCEENMSLKEISLIYGCSSTLIGLRLKQYGIKLKQKNGLFGSDFYIDEEFFETWSDEMAYLLGYITADGGVRPHKYELKMKSIDYELLEYAKKLLKTNYEIKSEKNTRCYVLVVYSKKIIESLAKLGIYARKSLTVQMAKVPDKYFWSYLRGLVDGDGTIRISSPKSTQIGFGLISNFDFLNSIKAKLSQKVNCRDYVLTAAGRAFALGVYGEYAYKCLKNMYMNDHYGLSRKKTAAISSIFHFERRINCLSCGKEIKFAHPNRKRCVSCSLDTNKECRRKYEQKQKTRNY